MKINRTVNCLRLDLKNNVIDLLDFNINVLKSIDIENKTTVLNDRESFNCIVFYHDKIDFILNCNSLFSNDIILFGNSLNLFTFAQKVVYIGLLLLC